MKHLMDHRSRVSTATFTFTLLHGPTMTSQGSVPARQQLQGWGAEQLVGQEINFLHDVGQPDRKLLPQEHKRGLLTGVS